MQNKIIIALLGICLLTIVACEKATNQDLSKPTVHIHKPIEGATYQSGDTLWMKVHFEDADQLHDFSVKVRNTTANTEEFSRDGHSHDTSYEAEVYTILQTTAHSDFELEAIVSNHNGATATEVVKFEVHP